ncbi:MAG: T9SS type A sorting domain-containing protein, partial [Tannerella sp.]|nr:T9SS type A sorting domain-containing protein [Tannerella sp.]
FDKWTGDIAGIANVNNASTTYTMGSANATVTATYKDAPVTTYTLTVNSGTGSGSYAPGTVVNISANTPPSGKVFDQWTGDIAGIANVNNASTTFTMGSANATVTATYKDAPVTTYTLTVNSGTGSGSYAPGTVVNISANTPPSGKVFDQWTGDIAGIANVNNASTTFTMGSDNATVTATYKDAPVTTYTLTVNSGSGSGSYAPGTVVNISANTPPSGKVFDKWTGDIAGIANVNNASTTYTMGSANATVTATYKDAPVTTYTLTVNSGTGSGSYAPGTVVNISANTPPANKVFDKWTGNVSGVAEIDSASTTYTMGSANATITATYKDDQTANEHIESGNGVKIHTEGSSLTVKSDNTELKSVEIYHVSGQLIRSIRANGAGTRIENLPGGVLIVKISLQGGRIETKKVRIK